MEEEEEGSLQTDKSVVTGEESRQFFGSELLGLGISTTESASSEWTDEKHSMYLSFIESSFVNQLYSQEQSSTYPSGWGPFRQEEILNNNSLLSSQNNSSEQFKILQRGRWQKMKFDRGQTQAHCGNELGQLLQNPWIQHFRQLSSNQNQEEEITVSKMELEAASIREATPVAGLCGKTINREPQLTKPSHMVCCQTSTTQNAEVSDQNFVDGSRNCAEDQINSPCRKKRVVSSLDPSDLPLKGKKIIPANAGQRKTNRQFI